MKISVVTGGFDPVHPGHIHCFKQAKEMSDMLVVYANSDKWLTRKKGKPFMSQSARVAILSSLECVDFAMPLLEHEDADDTACAALRNIRQLYPDSEILFVNGGDRGSENTPESVVAEELGVTMVYGAGEKIYSSSDFLANWSDNKTTRQWGNYNVIYDNINENIKIKVLEIEPGKAISLQTHEHRSEHWTVVQGTECRVTKGTDVTYHTTHSHIYIPKTCLHKLENTGDDLLRIVEIQYGDYLEEDDIQRFD